ncbi:MAG: hypothetical protein JNJ46_23110 [Myxococcales bacterium]|nr:hypothetical protein [Myxococcales bacterium]
MSPENHTLTLDELQIRFTTEDGKSFITWHGTSEIQDPAASIGGFLRSLIPVIQEKRVTMDFRPLEYMNSATIQPLLQIMREYNAAGIFTEIVYDANIEWQRIVFRSVASISTTLANVSIRRV